ncbi:hypothetical protein PC111_g10806 [Phytophthora cactorum]|nr:hypothetical protein PC111_g10806 [Phytophthora cactorum]
MLRWRKTVLHLQQATLRPEEQRRVDSATDSWMCTASARFKTQYVELTSFRGSKRKFWNVCLKIFNLTMQVTVLLELLEIGNPVALVYGYTAFISVGSLAGAIKILIGKFSAMGEVIAGCVFDLFAAIVFPVLVLVYCYYNFQFDDAVFATYLEILPIGSFERSAAVFADPSEMALFRLAFDSLRIKSWLDFVLRVGINLSFCYRLKRIGDVLLLELPDELRACRHLSSMELIYTGIQNIPPWAKEFKYLQTLHLEGKVGSQNLLSLPDDLFSDMPWLSTVHIGIHPELARLPSLSGVPNLQRVTLAWLLELRTLPSFDHVSRLQSLVLALMPRLEQIPDMAPLQDLSDFTLSRPIQLCCNGFRGVCDLTDNYCAKNPTSSIAAASCFIGEPFLGNAGTREAFNRFNASICQKMTSDLLIVPDAPTKQTIEMCNSKPFARCERPDGGIGICYNTRMQVLSCYGDDNYIRLRQHQIQKDVGQKCDPVLEEWLGCRD